MKLVHYTGSVPNFGDDLNALVWPALAPHLFTPDDEDRGFVGIGTILGMPSNRHQQLDVMSSGTGYDPISNWGDRRITFHCVRGPVTTHVLGLDPALAVADGALLCPLIPALPQRREGGDQIAVVPHFQTLAFPGWDEACTMAGMKLVDPRHPPEEVIRAITKSSLVLTESLHGAIIADTYGIPWLAFATSGNFCMPKWIDWTASVDVDFSVTYLPPPTSDPLLRFGKQRGAFGQRIGFTLEQACAEMHGRVYGAGKAGMRSKLAGWGKALGLHRLRQGYDGLGVARTAEALSRLSQAEGALSLPSRRDSLTDRLASILMTIN
jgi:succinoglycan biosynthesis protein ExoV